MSKVCGSANVCPYAPEQTTAGCPCADLCPRYCLDTYTITTTHTIQFRNFDGVADNRVYELLREDLK